MHSIEQRVISVVARVTKLDSSTIHETSVLSELGIDSLEVVNICFWLEEEFGIDIPNERTREVRTVAHMIAGVRELMGKAA